MSSHNLKAREAITAQDIERSLTVDEAQKLSEFDAQIGRSIEQFEAGLGRIFGDKEEFLDYLRNL